jgi:hypothetical protein
VRECVEYDPHTRTHVTHALGREREQQRAVHGTNLNGRAPHSRRVAAERGCAASTVSFTINAHNAHTRTRQHRARSHRPTLPHDSPTRTARVSRRSPCRWCWAASLRDCGMTASIHARIDRPSRRRCLSRSCNAATAQQNERASQTSPCVSSHCAHDSVRSITHETMSSPLHSP